MSWPDLSARGIRGRWESCGKIIVTLDTLAFDPQNKPARHGGHLRFATRETESQVSEVASPRSHSKYRAGIGILGSTVASAAKSRDY